MTHPVEVLPVRGVQGIVAPGVEDVLPVAVERQVQLNQNNTNITVNYIGGYPPYRLVKKRPPPTPSVYSRKRRGEAGSSASAQPPTQT